MKWFSRESRTENVVEDEMIAEAKTLTRYNGAVFCIYVLRLALEEAGVVWSDTVTRHGGPFAWQNVMILLSICVWPLYLKIHGFKKYPW